MICLYDVSFGARKEINIFQICSIEGDGEQQKVRMSNGDDHQISKKSADFLKERINQISQKLGIE